MSELRIQLQCTPSRLYVARYGQLPHPHLTPAQEFVHEIGITANCNAVVTDCVWRVFSGDDVYAVRQLMGQDLATLTGGELGVAPGLGLALRRVYFLLPTVIPLTRLRISIQAYEHERRQPLAAQINVPLQYFEQKTRLHLPFADGAWYAIMGNDWTDLHKADPTSQAFAYDFVKLGSDGGFFAGDGLRNEDHYAWGQPVLAPAPGKVLHVQDGLPDVQPGEPPDIERYRHERRLVSGNTVVIGHGHGECSYLAHLQAGSIGVRSGDYVKRGQQIGRVGNSGISQGPHLHYHLQDGPNLFVDQGLPVQFSRFTMAGDHIEQSAIPSRAIVSPWS